MVREFSLNKKNNITKKKKSLCSGSLHSSGVGNGTTQGQMVTLSEGERNGGSAVQAWGGPRTLGVHADLSA